MIIIRESEREMAPLADSHLLQLAEKCGFQRKSVWMRRKRISVC